MNSSWNAWLGHCEVAATLVNSDRSAPFTLCFQTDGAHSGGHTQNTVKYVARTLTCKHTKSGGLKCWIFFLETFESVCVSSSRVYRLMDVELNKPLYWHSATGLNYWRKSTEGLVFSKLCPCQQLLSMLQIHLARFCTYSHRCNADILMLYLWLSYSNRWKCWISSRLRTCSFE